jgi:hypothetical protein
MIFERFSFEPRLHPLDHHNAHRMPSFSRSVSAVVAVVCLGNLTFAQSHFAFTSGTGSNATVIVPTSANPNISGTPLASGDEIGAFTPSGLCVGASVWGGSNMAITVWGASLSPPLPGIQSGEAMSYRIWRQSSNTEFSNVSVTYSNTVPATNWDGLYHENGIYVLTSISAMAAPAVKYVVTSNSYSVAAGSSVTISAQLADVGNNPVPTSGKIVAWSSTNGGTFGNPSSATNGSGIAAVTFTTSATVGTVHVVTATDNTSLVGTCPSITTIAQLSISVTVAATNVTLTSAQLNGTVNPNGSSTSYYFEYGTSTSYGTQTGSASAGSGTNAMTVNAAVSGLTPGTLYHYQVVATNGAGTSRGSDMTFTTTAIAPTVATVAASNVATATAQLNGTVNPNGLSTTYYFEYGTSTSYGTQSSVTSSGSGANSLTVNATVSGLTPATMYHYRVVATNSAGTSQGSDMAFTTATAALAPSAETVAVTNITLTGAQLNGTVNPNGTSTTYYFEYGTTTSYGTQTTVTSAGSGTSASSVNAVLSGLIPATVYHYRVVATNSGGTSQGSDLTFTTVLRPTAITLAATNATLTGAQLNGTVNPNGASTTYYFEYGTTTSYGTQTNTAIAGSGTSALGVNAVLSGLTPTTLYHYRVVATNSVGTIQGSDMTVTTGLGPSAATLAATNVTLSGAQLNGTINPNGSSTTYYFEYGTTTGYGAQTTNTSAGSGTSPSSVNTIVSGLTPSSFYHYRVVAANSVGMSQGSDMTFTTALPPIATTLAATNVTLTGAQLNGTINPNGSSTTYYFEYGTTTGYGTQTSSAVAGSGTSALSVNAVMNGLISATVYHFRAVATSNTGSSQGSDMTFTTGTTPVGPTAVTVAATTITIAGAQLNGSVNPNGSSTTYYFEYGTTTSYGTQTGSASAGSGTSALSLNAIVNGLTSSTLYHYRIVATNSTGVSQGSDMTFMTAGVAPTVATFAASNVAPTTAQVNGTVNPNGSSTTYYFEYGTTTSYGTRTSSTGAGSGTTVSSVNSALSGLSPVTVYHYRVVASNGGGTSQGSDMTFTTALSPTASTLAASSVTLTGALLNGAVSPNGASTTYYFEYGTTASYGTQTGSASAGSGSRVINYVSAFLSGLTPAALYHYRVVATNSGGTSQGNDTTFATVLSPTATTILATNLSLTTAQVNGAVNPNGASTTYYFEYGTTSGYGTQTSGASAGSGMDASNVNAVLSGLTPATLYHYRVVAANSAGAGRGGDVTFMTVLLPTATTLAPTNFTGTSARLNGTVNPNGSSTSYYFEYGTTTSYGTQTSSGNVGSGTTASNVSAVVNGLTPFLSYHYRLVATNSLGTRWGDDATFLLTAVDEKPDGLPHAYRLGQNYPNPFNPSTTIEYALPKAATVLLRVFNELGQVVAALAEGLKQPGVYRVSWNPSLPSGVYFYRLEASDFFTTKVMILLK